MQTSAKKQKLLIEYLISSPDIFALCKSIVKSDYFDPEFRKTVDFLHDYYDKYNHIPSADQIEAETNVELKTRITTPDEIEYCATEIETFCKFHAFRLAVISAPKFMDEQNYGAALEKMNEAMAVSLNRDLGIQYFEDPLGRLERMMTAPSRTPTLWVPFDELTNGGVGRKELVLFSANSGGGKSITLANLAVNLLQQRLNVMYITLELSEDLVAQRFDTMFTAVPSVIWQQKYKEIATNLYQISTDTGKLAIKHMPVGTNSNQIRSYLKEFQLKQGYVPDVLIVDYLDIMGTNEKVDANNVSNKDKLATEQLREIVFDYNMIGLTASQQNRAAIDAEQINQGHIAGGITKVNTVDVYVSIILTPTMKASGEIGMIFLKTRNSGGAGETIYLTWINNSLRIVTPAKSHKGDDFSAVIGNKAAQCSKNSTSQNKLSLLDIMDM